VNLYYADERGSLGAPDVVILPGTKNTIGDLAWLRKSGLERFILSTIDQRPSTMLIGICGGYQMLGERIRDRAGVESKKRETEGLGLLSITTDLEEEKVLCQVRAREIETGLDVTGYEIHHGKTTLLGGCRSLFKIVERKAQALGDEERDGTISEDSRIWGTYIHGLFDEDLFRRSFLNRIRARKNRPALRGRLSFDVEREFDKLAKLLRDNIDMKLLYKILN
jgi:adenosylcobyric acid synthase